MHAKRLFLTCVRTDVQQAWGCVRREIDRFLPLAESAIAVLATSTVGATKAAEEGVRPGKHRLMRTCGWMHRDQRLSKSKRPQATNEDGAGGGGGTGRGGRIKAALLTWCDQQPAITSIDIVKIPAPYTMPAKHEQISASFQPLITACNLLTQRVVVMGRAY
jgi:hypothetical protein